MRALDGARMSAEFGDVVAVLVGDCDVVNAAAPLTTVEVAIAESEGVFAAPNATTFPLAPANEVPLILETVSFVETPVTSPPT